MAFPTKNLAYVAEGLSRFTSRFTATAAPNLRLLTAIYLQGAQDLELVLFDIIEKKWLANAVGVDLDTIGAIVGQVRTGLDDDTYRAAIRLRIQANKSQGRADDVVRLGIAIATHLTGDSNGLVLYKEFGTASFSLTVYDLLYPAIAQDLLTEARAAGTAGRLLYSTWPAAQNLILSSTVGATAHTGPMDRVSGNFPFKLISATDLL